MYLTIKEDKNHTLNQYVILFKINLMTLSPERCCLAESKGKERRKEQRSDWSRGLRLLAKSDSLTSWRLPQGWGGCWSSDLTSLGGWVGYWVLLTSLQLLIQLEKTFAAVCGW